MRDFVVLTINGQRHEIKEAAFMMLSDYLRQNLGLKGTKIVCAEGDCGACTVLCLKKRPDESLCFEPINSCIALVGLLDNSQILTVEALKEEGQLNPVQEALSACHASQCGFCTPGFVMALSALIENSSEVLGEQQIKNGLTGNLCRCTGYQSIIEAAVSINKNSYTPLLERYNEPSLKIVKSEACSIICDDNEFLAPKTISQACDIRSKKPDVRIVAAATDLGVLHNKNKTTLNKIMSLHLIEELDTINIVKDRIIVGALVSLNRLRDYTKNKTPELARFLNIFASPQIKNVATLVGNVANGSPIADTLPFLLIADGQVHTRDSVSSREIPITEFYRGYKSLALKPSEIITHVSFGLIEPSYFFRLYKISQRKDLDISTVNAAFLVKFASSITFAKIAVGGVAATALRLYKTEDFLKDKILDDEVIDQAAAILHSEIKPIDDLRGSAKYRHAVLDGFFRQYLSELKKERM